MGQRCRVEVAGRLRSAVHSNLAEYRMAAIQSLMVVQNAGLVWLKAAIPTYWVGLCIRPATAVTMKLEFFDKADLNQWRSLFETMQPVSWL